LEAVHGRATALGSWPGTSAVEAARTSFGELGEPPHVPYLPELPARGPGADLIGRAAGVLVDLPVDLQPSGWRLVDRPGRDAERTRAWLRQDLDVLAEVADGYRGPLKMQVAGPWTLAAALELPRLERAVADPGACRDLVASLCEGVAVHVAEVRRLVPGAAVLLQVDEPSLPVVLAGGVPTASGFGRVAAIEEPVVVDGLREVLDAARAGGAVAGVVHCCNRAVPVDAIVRAGADAVSLDPTLLGASGWDEVAAAVEAGVALWAGVLPASGPPPRPSAESRLAENLWRAWTRVGLGGASAAGIVVTPSCGLAGTSPAAARATLAACRDVASALAELAQA
jgi:hypothetical protein